MTITETLRECHAIVWRYRAELEHVWPTPNTEDALLFAFTELGEAIDAHLRTRDTYARNRDKSLDVLDELADCAMMLLTALGADYGFPDNIERNFRHEWDSYAMAMGETVFHGVNPEPRTAHWWMQDAWEMLQRIATHPGMDLPARLTARLERIKAKRLPPPTIGVVDAYEQRKVAHGSEAP